MRFHRYAAALVLAATVAGVAIAQRDAPVPVPAASTPEIAAPSAADVAFAHGMLAHHEQAVRMSHALLAKPGVPERIRAIADFIAHDQQREIDEMGAWLAAWNAPAAEHAHADGMLTDAQLRDLDEALPATAGPLFLRLMIEHHEGAITMARALLDGDWRNVYTHGLAKHVINEQTDENRAMAALL